MVQPKHNEYSYIHHIGLAVTNILPYLFHHFSQKYVYIPTIRHLSHKYLLCIPKI